MSNHTFCAFRSHRKRSQPRRHKTEDQKSLGDVMAIETALEDVKVKEELKRGPDLEEEERSKGMEGEGEARAVRSSKTPLSVTCLLLFISVEISAEFSPIFNLCSVKYVIVHSSN